jgi:hypothetical protein
MLVERGQEACRTALVKEADIRPTPQRWVLLDSVRGQMHQYV